MLCEYLNTLKYSREKFSFSILINDITISTTIGDLKHLLPHFYVLSEYLKPYTTVFRIPNQLDCSIFQLLDRIECLSRKWQAECLRIFCSVCVSVIWSEHTHRAQLAQWWEISNCSRKMTFIWPDNWSKAISFATRHAMWSSKHDGNNNQELF